MNVHTNITYVTSNSQLLRELEPYTQAKQIAFDIETTRTGYRGGPMGSDGAIRLMQLGLGGMYKERQLVVDLFHVDPQPVFDILENPDQEILIHNASFEVSWLLYQYGVNITNIFDTCAIYKHIQKLRRERGSRHEQHANGLGQLAEKLLGLIVDKSNQKSDWSREILSPDQIKYAALDVALLPPIASRIRVDMRRENIAREQMHELSNRIGPALLARWQDLDLANADEASVLVEAMWHAETCDELHEVWRARRNMSLWSEHRVGLARLYRDKLGGLQKPTLARTLV